MDHLFKDNVFSIVELMFFLTIMYLRGIDASGSLRITDVLHAGLLHVISNKQISFKKLQMKIILYNFSQRP